MQLIVFRGDEELKVVATKENISVALQDIYAKKNDAIILDDPDYDRYMQTAGGWHIEYQLDMIQYAAEKVPLVVAP